MLLFPEFLAERPDFLTNRLSASSKLTCLLYVLLTVHPLFYKLLYCRPGAE